MATSALNNFGQISRALRIKKMKTIADQAQALQCAPSEISKYETGAIRPTLNYISRFSEWINADIIVQKELIKSAGSISNVIRFEKKKENERRLFRKVNKLSPYEIRTIRAGNRERQDGQ